MFDDTNNGVTNYDSEAEKQAQVEVEQPETSVEQTQEDKTAQQFKQLREDKERLAKERDDHARKLKEYEAVLAAQKQPQIEPESDEIRLGDDELAEGKHLAKLGKKIRNLESQIKQYQQVNTEATVEAQIKAQYPDFDKVVTADSINALKQDYPEIAATINNNPDLKSKAVAAYTLMKKLGIYTEDIYEKDRQVAQRNAAKPRPVNSIAPQQGESPLARANAFAEGLTEDLQKALRKEMLDAMKNR